MKVGISTKSLCNTVQTEDAFELIKQSGADCVEVCLQTFYEYRPEFAKQFAPRAAGLEVTSVRVSPANFEPQLFSDNRRIRGDGFYWLDQVMRSAQLFGAKNYAFQSINFNPDRLNEIIYFCARYGVKLCLEPDSPYIFKQLKNSCPDLAGVLDIDKAKKSGYPYGMYIEDMAGNISQVHIPDIDRTDFEELFKRLKGAGFDGTLFIDGCEDLKRSVEFLKEIVDKIN